MSKSKRSLMIVTIAIALVLSVAGISFAAWANYYNADASWDITANTPGTLTITDVVSESVNYNGQSGIDADMSFATSSTATLNSTVATPLGIKLMLTVKMAGSEEFVVAAGSSVAIFAEDGVTAVTELAANTATAVKIVVTFADYSDVTYYGATFKIAIELGVIA